MTSIEYIIEQLASHMIGFNTKAHIINKIIDEAKEMHKQEIIDAATWGTLHETADKYYQETFGLNNG